MPKSNDKDDATDNIQAVALTLDILELLSGRAEPIGVSEISQHLSVQKSRVFRHLRTLVARGYALQDPHTEKYMAGSRLYALGQNVAHSSGFIAVMRPFLHRLMEKLEVVVTLSRLEGGVSRVAEICSSPHWIGVTIPIGMVLPFHATAHGKVALAFGDKALRDKALAGPLDALTPATIADHHTLEVEIARIRAQGWASSPGESLTGIGAVAAPVFDAGGRFAGAIGLVGSVQQVKPIPEQKQVEALIETSRAASRRLGFAPPSGDAAAPEPRAETARVPS